MDEKGFAEAMEEQKVKARSARKATNYMGADVTVYESIDPGVTTEFVGYDRLEHESGITVLTTETEIVEALADGDTGTIFVEETPFYATMGGQCADTGIIAGQDGEFQVMDTVKLLGGKVGHIGKVTKGMFKIGDRVTLKVDAGRRGDTCKNHSATHLLQKALRTVLGTHVEQAGSYVDGERLRFDFSHFSAMTKEEIAKVEQMVNEKIAQSIPVVTSVMSIEEAKKSGAMALFGEKYGETVRVVKMGEFSTELCGGTHVANTGAIAHFKILSESGVAAGIRRIEALTGTGVLKYFEGLEETLAEAAKTVKTTPAGLIERLEHLMAEVKALQSENESLKSKAAKDALGDVMNQVQDIRGVKFLAVKVSGVDMNGLRDLGDQLKAKIGEGVIVLFSDVEGKVNLVAFAAEDAMSKGCPCGQFNQRDRFPCRRRRRRQAQYGSGRGQNPAGIEQAIAEAAKVLEGQLK